ncbi:hypothetical protein MMC28_007940 [Mycoblastus sanguinarius]|nr:hypothetical protein [Mycoblastus sanguinarius]
MLTLFASALVFSLLPHPLAAQFAAYPVCVQPLLNQNFPASCLSLSLVAQNTCLCQDADAFGSTLVKAVNQECGCADLQETAQLAEAYCTQVGVDIGPAFGVFIQDNTPCGGSSSGSSGVSATGSGGSGGGATSTGSGGSTVTVSAGGGGTSTGSGASTVTVGASGGGTSSIAGGGASTGSAGGGTTAGSTTKNSGANDRLAVEQIVGIVVIGVTGGMLALLW